MGKHKKYSVDRTGYDRDDIDDKRFAKFETLKQAVRFARRHGIPGEKILDLDGNTIPGLDVDELRWFTRKELEDGLVRLRDEGQRATKRANLLQEINLNTEASMVSAGFIPVHVLRNHMGSFEQQGESEGLHRIITTTIRLQHGLDEPKASMYRQSPFEMALRHLRDGN